MVSSVGASVSEESVASIFRLKLQCIVLVDVMVLWYVMCGFFRRCHCFGGFYCLHLQIKITIMVLVDVMVLWYVTWCGFFRRCQRFGGFCCLYLQIKITIMVLVDVMVLWYVMCDFLCRYQRFGGCCCLHLHVKIVFYCTHTNNIVCIYISYIRRVILEKAVFAQTFRKLLSFINLIFMDPCIVV